MPLHIEGWAHFSKSRDDIERAFAAAQLQGRVRRPVAGHPLSFANMPRVRHDQTGGDVTS